ncbi:hypothetical protein PoB_006033900 [Plakobranchus ocellatus]|uniref:Uncharacterized protein n=1 Tax=Plakobranchus ocellatus TaxID=259542 RepID=A0AAV4CPQ4_9GAST|nr:hypothetical protein PoB_006033900 [Plakobranchus ocellatus]
MRSLAHWEHYTISRDTGLQGILLNLVVTPLYPRNVTQSIVTAIPQGILLNLFVTLEYDSEPTQRVRDTSIPQGILLNLSVTLGYHREPYPTCP